MKIWRKRKVFTQWYAMYHCHVRPRGVDMSEASAVNRKWQPLGPLPKAKLLVGYM